MDGRGLGVCGGGGGCEEQNLRRFFGKSFTSFQCNNFLGRNNKGDYSLTKGKEDWPPLRFHCNMFLGEIDSRYIQSLIYLRYVLKQVLKHVLCTLDWSFIVEINRR